MLKDLHPITMEAAIEVASNLRSDDYREVVEGHGLDIDTIPSMVLHGQCYYFKAPNGKIAAIGGVYNDGMIWMLCTPTIEEYPYRYARFCKRFIASRPETVLWNIVDKRNTIHLKLLKFLGFKFIREIKHGPHQLSFIEFYRVRRSRN